MLLGAAARLNARQWQHSSRLGVVSSQLSKNLVARKQFATVPQSIATPKRKRSRLGRIAITLWRASYLSVLGGIGWYAYSVYESRHPNDQIPPDPSKKTLVVLGSGWGSTSLLKGIDAENYNIIVVSPRNYFLFTPLLPSTATGTVESRSIMQPIRHVIRHKKASVQFFEAECTKVDNDARTVTIRDSSSITGDISENTIPFDYLVVGIGAENSTFGIKGVKEHACFLKEIWDAGKIRQTIMDCVETATFANQSDAERERLLHMVVVGGGPTGIEFAAELQDFFAEDLKNWYPEIASKFKVTLVEALPNVLPSFSKSLIDYTESTFKESKIEIHTGTAWSRKSRTRPSWLPLRTEMVRLQNRLSHMVCLCGLLETELAMSSRTSCPSFRHKPQHVEVYS